MKDRNCLRCNLPMAIGCLIDHGDNTYIHASSFIAGSPQKGWFNGLKIDKKQLLQIVAFRCPQCAMVELTAPDPREIEQGALSLSQGDAPEGALEVIDEP